MGCWIVGQEMVQPTRVILGSSTTSYTRPSGLRKCCEAEPSTQWWKGPISSTFAAWSSAAACSASSTRNPATGPVVKRDPLGVVESVDQSTSRIVRTSGRGTGDGAGRPGGRAPGRRAAGAGRTLSHGPAKNAQHGYHDRAASPGFAPRANQVAAGRAPTRRGTAGQSLVSAQRGESSGCQ